MDIKIVKITAIGSNLRLMTFVIDDDHYFIVRISLELYSYLKDYGVPTAQKLRKGSQS